MKRIDIKRKRAVIIALCVFLCLSLIGIVSEISNAKKVEAQKKAAAQEKKELEKYKSLKAPEKSVKFIIMKHFPSADIEYHEDTKEVYLNVKVSRNYDNENEAFDSEGTELAACVSEVMQFDKEVKWNDVTISSKKYPSIITCIFNSTAVQNINDWENFGKRDLIAVCDAYSDCTGAHK